MILNKQTFEKVRNLFPTMPYNSVAYAGCWSADTVSFEVGQVDENHNYVCGVHVTITRDFKIVRLQRLKTIWSTRTKKFPTITEKIPLHPAGQKPLIYAIIDNPKVDLSRYGIHINF